MGSHLAPVLANIFIGFYKSKWLSQYDYNTPIYFRYVPGILAVFVNEQIYNTKTS